MNKPGGTNEAVASEPLYGDDVGVQNFDGELIDLEGSEIGLEGEESLFGEPGKKSRTTVTALKLIERCAEIKEGELSRLQAAHDEVLRLSISMCINEDNGEGLVEEAQWALQLAHRDLDLAYKRFRHYDKLVDTARRKLQENLSFQKPANFVLTQERLEQKRFAKLLEIDVPQHDIGISMLSAELGASVTPLKATPSHQHSSNTAFISVAKQATIVQAFFKMVVARRRYLRIRDFFRRLKAKVLKQHLLALRGLFQASNVYTTNMKKKGFAALLGYGNIRCLRRVFATDILLECRQKQTIKVVFVMWYRYTAYIQAPVDKETGFRSRKFPVYFQQWDDWVENDAGSKKIRGKVHFLNFGDTVLSCLLQWVAYTKYRRGRREKTILARAHHNYTSLRRAFVSWMFVVMNKMQVQAKETATLIFYLGKWKHFTNLQHSKVHNLQCIEKVSTFRFFSVWRRKTDTYNVLRIAGIFRLIHKRPLSLMALGVIADQEILLPMVLKWMRWKAYVMKRKIFRIYVSRYWAERSAQLLKAVFQSWFHVVIVNDNKRAHKLKDLCQPVLAPYPEETKVKHEFFDAKNSLPEHTRTTFLHGLTAQVNMLFDQFLADNNIDGRRLVNSKLTSILTDELPEQDFDTHTRNQHLIKHHWDQWNSVTNNRDGLLINRLVRLASFNEHETLHIHEPAKSPQHDSLQDPLVAPFSVRAGRDEEVKRDEKHFALERSKALLASLGSPFYDARNATVDVEYCNAYIEDVRKVLYCMMCRKARRELRTVTKYTAQCTALRINHQNPNFTIRGVLGPSELPFIMQQFQTADLRISSKKLSRKSPLDQQQLSPHNTAKPVYPTLRYVVRASMHELLGQQGRENILTFKYSRFRITRLLHQLDHQFAVLPDMIDGISSETRSRRIGTLKTLQYKTAFQTPLELKIRFGNVSREWRSKVSRKVLPVSAYSVLNLVGFNPSLVRRRDVAQQENVSRRDLSREEAIIARMLPPPVKPLERTTSVLIYTPQGKLGKRRWTLGSSYDKVFGIERSLEKQEDRRTESLVNTAEGSGDDDDDAIEQELERILQQEREAEAQRKERMRQQAASEAQVAMQKDREAKREELLEMQRIEEEKRQAARTEKETEQQLQDKAVQEQLEQQKKQMQEMQEQQEKRRKSSIAIQEARIAAASIQRPDSTDLVVIPSMKEVTYDSRKSSAASSVHSAFAVGSFHISSKKAAKKARVKKGKKAKRKANKTTQNAGSPRVSDTDTDESEVIENGLMLELDLELSTTLDGRKTSVLRQPGSTSSSKRKPMFVGEEQEEAPSPVSRTQSVVMSQVTEEDTHEPPEPATSDTLQLSEPAGSELATGDLVMIDAQQSFPSMSPSLPATPLSPLSPVPLELPSEDILVRTETELDPIENSGADVFLAAGSGHVTTTSLDDAVVKEEARLADQHRNIIEAARTYTTHSPTVVLSIPKLASEKIEDGKRTRNAAEVLLTLTAKYSCLLNAQTRQQISDLQRVVFPLDHQMEVKAERTMSRINRLRAATRVSSPKPPPEPKRDSIVDTAVSTTVIDRSTVRTPTLRTPKVHRPVHLIAKTTSTGFTKIQFVDLSPQPQPSVIRKKVPLLKGQGSGAGAGPGKAIYKPPIMKEVLSSPEVVSPESSEILSPLSLVEKRRSLHTPRRSTPSPFSKQLEPFSPQPLSEEQEAKPMTLVSPVASTPPASKPLMAASPEPLPSPKEAENTLPLPALAFVGGRRGVRTKPIETKQLPLVPSVVQVDEDQQFWDEWVKATTHTLIAGDERAQQAAAEDLEIRKTLLKRKLLRAQELISQQKFGADTLIISCSERIEQVEDMLHGYKCRGEQKISSRYNACVPVAYKKGGLDEKGNAVTKPNIASLRGRAKSANTNFRTLLINIKKAAADGKLPKVDITGLSVTDLISDAFRSGQTRMALALYRAGRKMFSSEWWAQEEVGETSEELWRWFLAQTEPRAAVNTMMPRNDSDSEHSVSPEAGSATIRWRTRPKTATPCLSIASRTPCYPSFHVG